MGYQLRMSEEIAGWLTELRDSEPATATRVGQALAALMTDGDGMAPRVTRIDSANPEGSDVPAALDAAYDRLLGEMNDLRRGAAESPERARQLAEELRAEQERVNAFRVRKEVLKASYLAAQTEVALSELGLGGLAEDQAADGSVAAEAAAARLGQVSGEIERELGPIRPAEGLLALRTDPGAGSGISILFAFEPPGAALLIAVVEDTDAASLAQHEAVEVASEILRAVRAGDDPDASARRFDDLASLREAFLPDTAAGGPPDSGAPR